MQSTLNSAAVHWCLAIPFLYEKHILISANALAQDCCQLLLHNSKHQQGMHLLERCCCALNFSITHLYEKQILIGVRALAQHYFKLPLHSSTEHQGMHIDVNGALVHWYLQLSTCANSKS